MIRLTSHKHHGSAPNPYNHCYIDKNRFKVEHLSWLSARECWTKVIACSKISVHKHRITMAAHQAQGVTNLVDVWPVLFWQSRKFVVLPKSKMIRWNRQYFTAFTDAVKLSEEQLKQLVLRNVHIICSGSVCLIFGSEQVYVHVVSMLF